MDRATSRSGRPLRRRHDGVAADCAGAAEPSRGGNRGAAVALATPLPLLLFTELSAQRIYIAQLLVAILAAVIGSLPWVRRFIVPKRASRAAGHRAALAQFVVRGLDRSQCGALVYVSLAEHYIRIVPAEDAAKAVAQEQWQTVVDEALGSLAAGETESALIGT